MSSSKTAEENDAQYLPNSSDSAFIVTKCDSQSMICSADIVEAFSDFCSLGEGQLSFKCGDKINILEKPNGQWWWAELCGRYGYIPVNHVSSLTQEEGPRESWEDEEYFSSYGGLKLQHEMLADQARTEAYKSAIEQNADFLQGKTVLDVGCGTGILSLFCAKYGQVKKVYAVEKSAMVEHAQQLVTHNGFTGVIEVINDFAEHIDLPEKVDVIISEWMGTALLFEMMLEAVLSCRDRFLAKPGGVMWPSTARLHLVPCSAGEVYAEKAQFWTRQYGIDISPLRDAAIDEFFCKPLHNHRMSPDDALAKEKTIVTIDLQTVTISDLETIEESFDFEVTKTSFLHGLCTWFSVDFAGCPQIRNVVTLNTGPYDKWTHWKHNLFMLDQPVSVLEGDHVTGKFKMWRHPKWRRHLRVNFEVTVTHLEGEDTTISKEFRLWR